MSAAACSPTTGPTETVQPARWKPMPGTMWLFYVDIVGGCNLACPSCPIGNSREVPIAKGYMAPELLGRIVDKAVAECAALEFSLYNWTEPFLHPDLPAMVRAVRSRNVRCSLSTNLNIIKNLDAVLRENPSKIKISLSGFEQATYGVTHKKGDIERVKQNLVELAAARDRTKCSTDLVIGFHRYLGNHEEEQRMREFAAPLGIAMEPQWAYLMPLEKVLAYADPAASSVELQPEDHAVIDRLALRLDDALAVARNSPHKPCQLRDRMMSLNLRGEVQLCCTVFDQQAYGLGSYLDHSLTELQELKYQHWQCAGCMQRGLHTLFTYDDPAFDDVAMANVRSHYPEARLSSIRPSEPARPSVLRRVAGRVKRIVKLVSARSKK